MNHVIIGTAGHVDHGKTLLIKANQHKKFMIYVIRA